MALDQCFAAAVETITATAKKSTNMSQDDAATEISAEAVLQDFSSMIMAVVKETDQLKTLASLRSSVVNEQRGSLVQAQLQEIDSHFASLSLKVSALMVEVEKEENFLDKTVTSLQKAIQAQSQHIHYMQQNIPAHLPGDHLLLSKDGQTAKSTTQNLGISVGLLKAVEYDQIPRTVKGRVTLDQINAAILEIVELFRRKSERLSIPRKTATDYVRAEILEYESQKLPEHGNRIFALEKELRGCDFFKQSSSAGKTILTVLRSTKRLKLVTGNGQSSYMFM